MNTFSMQFSRITSDFPEYEEALSRLAPVLNAAATGTTGLSSLYSVSRLFGIIQPESLEQLKGILLALMRSGIFEQILRVEPNGRFVIADFHRLSEIPVEMLDPNNDETIQIQPDDIKVYYRLRSPKAAP